MTFEHSQGDQLVEKKLVAPKPVGVNQRFNVRVQCKAPQSEGVYTEYFKLRSAAGLFGPTFWCQIIVKKPVIEEEVKVVAP